METEDLIDLPASSSCGCKSEKENLNNSNCEPSEADSQPSNSAVKEDELNGEILGNEGEVGYEDNPLLLATAIDKDLVDNTSILQVSVEVTETVTVAEKMSCISSGVNAENGCLTVRDGSPINSHKRDGSSISNHEIDGSSISGVKRARVTVDEQEPSVHVMYNSLTRDSKHKLEELLQQWSEWHAQHCSSPHDSNEVLESGEGTYFPALHVGLDKPSAVSFWMDNQTRNQQSKEFISLDSGVPLYDRGYSLGLTSTDGSSNLEGGLEIVDASRCFNCGSYNHSLKECPKPRDNVAVNNARKQHKSRRNQNASSRSSSRNPTRYYQNSPGGKYDGLRPGVLGAETRQLLGLGELDPPPWLKRMREIGYPLGYLDPEDEDQPSGITIFADGESKEGKEDGEILETGYLEPPRKMSVEFPGINSPIPENADERCWAAGPSSFNLSGNRSHGRFNHSSGPISTGQYPEQRRPRDFRDEGPPGCDPGFSPTLSTCPQRYGGYDSSYASPSFGRSLSDRGRWSPLFHEGSSNHGSYSSLPYSPQNRLLSPQNYGSASFKYQDDSRNYFTSDSSSHHKYKHEAHFHHSRR
uniref:CCHC-type domain-containing protein n=1 Tax=Davidia involucrata TaxID=16924 RepID=A0A5B6ZBF1_DAVIN